MRPAHDDAPTVISTFAGCGGSSLGYSMAGYRELAAVEWEDHAASMLRLNFPHVPILQADIAKITSSDFDIPDTGLDVLDGSPPCQGFSTAGKRQLNDPRNFLFRQFTRTIEELDPRVIVMENVTGMNKGEHKSLFNEVVQALGTAGRGYAVKVRELHAERLGIPQTRHRLVFIGVRRDLGIQPVHPGPVRGGVPTVAYAIADLRPEELGYMEFPTGTTKMIAPHLGQGMDTSHIWQMHTGQRRGFSISRASWSRPCGTLLKQFGSNFAGVLHPLHDRYLSSRELARIQSFPDQYDWGDSTYRQIHARIGNSVPPLMMRAIASTIHTEILNTP